MIEILALLISIPLIILLWMAVIYIGINLVDSFVSLQHNRKITKMINEGKVYSIGGVGQWPDTKQ